jgi:hypothetical protein
MKRARLSAAKGGGHALTLVNRIYCSLSTTPTNNTLDAPIRGRYGLRIDGRLRSEQFDPGSLLLRCVASCYRGWTHTIASTGIVPSFHEPAGGGSHARRPFWASVYRNPFGGSLEMIDG